MPRVAPSGRPRAAPCDLHTLPTINYAWSRAVRAQLTPERVSRTIRWGWVAALVAGAKPHHCADHAVWFSH